VAFADPQSVTINAVANSLPRVGITSNVGTFQKDDGTVRLTVSQSNGKRNRRSLRLDFQKVAADPFTTGVNNLYSMKAELVVDTPPTGFTITEQKQIVDALTAYLTASSGARVTQLLGGEL
jgi:hypothetical protein